MTRAGSLTLTEMMMLVDITSLSRVSPSSSTLRVCLKCYNARAIFCRRSKLVSRAKLFLHRLVIADPVNTCELVSINHNLAF